MTITKINSNSYMLEFLQNELNYNSENDLIYHILNIVATTEKLNANNCSFLLESVRSKKGTIFLLTIKQGRKRYKIKRNPDYTIFCFKNCQDFLSCIYSLHKSQYSISNNFGYIMNSNYYLVFSNSYITQKTKFLIAQYGQKCKNGNLLLCKLKEYGKLIANNCVYTIGTSLTYKDF